MCCLVVIDMDLSLKVFFGIFCLKLDIKIFVWLLIGEVILSIIYIKFLDGVLNLI